MNLLVGGPILKDMSEYFDFLGEVEFIYLKHFIFNIILLKLWSISQKIASIFRRIHILVTSSKLIIYFGCFNISIILLNEDGINSK